MVERDLKASFQRGKRHAGTFSRCHKTRCKGNMLRGAGFSLWTLSDYYKVSATGGMFAA